MTDFYASQFIGVVDGTKSPPDRADGRVVGYRPRGIVATKPAGQALASGDRLYIGRKRVGETVRRIAVTASASLATSTLSVGTTAAPTKYANVKTMTTADVPTAIGPAASAADDSPDGAYEDLWLTVGTATIAGGTTLVIDIDIAGLN